MRKMFYTERTLIKRNSKKVAISIRAMIRERVEIWGSHDVAFSTVAFLRVYFVAFFSGFIDITYFMDSYPC